MTAPLLVLTLLVAQAAQAAPVVRPDPQPFFTNDVVGFLKLLGLAAGIVAATATFFYKFTHGKVEQDVTNLGAKVDGVVKAHETTKGAVTALERDSARCIQDIGHLREGHGQLREAVEAINKNGAELHRDITTMIAASQGQLTQAINQVAVEVAGLKARLEERDRFAMMLERLERDRGNAPGR